ncbi:MAG: ligase-associated DNA damage response exonuclease [bacterium]
MIRFTEHGLYCEAGDFHIDPWRPVRSAVITHAHSDHARPGHGHYLCARAGLSVLRSRLGAQTYEAADWSEPVYRNGVRISFHPSGHIIGAAQVRIEYRGEVWVVSGDYKTEDDGISGYFEPVKCHTFVTESTFGLPVYQWQPQTVVYDEIRNWVSAQLDQGRSAVLQAYSLGKSQRLLDALRPFDGRIFAHGAILQIQEALRADGHDFPQTKRLTEATPAEQRKACIFITPAPVETLKTSRLIGPWRSARCSGWMQVRGNRRREGGDKGFVLSDHADWAGLCAAVKATSAQRVFVTHGFQSVFSRYLNEIGLEAHEVQTGFGSEEETEVQTENAHPDA